MAAEIQPDGDLRQSGDASLVHASYPYDPFPPDNGSPLTLLYERQGPQRTFPDCPMPVRAKSGRPADKFRVKRIHVLDKEGGDSTRTR